GHLIVIGRQSTLSQTWLSDGLVDGLSDWIVRSGKDASPGRLGSPSRSLLNVAGGPDKLTVIALDDDVTHHVSEARTEEIWRQLKGVAGGVDGNVGVVVGLTHADQAFGATLGVSRCFPLYSRKTKKKDPAKISVLLRTETGIIDDIAPLQAAADSQRLIQRFVDSPAAELNTETYEAEVRGACEPLADVEVYSIVGDDLLEHGMGGLHAVGRTAMKAPRLVVMDYNPAGSTDVLALVGKGLVYDTGGLSLKIAGDRMLTMKCDMGGSAAVFGAFLTLVKTGYANRIICTIGMAENAIGPDSYRPDDVLSMHSGRTVEINNTDAEGRLALADAASYVTRKYNPSLVVEAATLTGAQLMATGKGHAGICATSASLEKRAIAAGLLSGDHCLAMLWSPAHMAAEFKSSVADMRNSVADRMNASSAAAGYFVYSHIEDTKVPFLHIDLAGPSFRENRATGYGVGLIATVLRSLTGDK
ncbi:MAG TPA: peptidase M17, partial [Myxococcales bacterium]|nr:peptidase M17 [Myxococcales bacterium]